MTWPSTELLQIYTSVCEITAEQSITVLNLWWIPKAKKCYFYRENLIYTPMCWKNLIYK